LLRRTATGREIAGQLLRSGTSSGANYEEARGAQSRADFLHKLQIVLKELRESLFWLRLIDKAQIMKEHNVASMIDETRQLSNHCKVSRYRQKTEIDSQFDICTLPITLCYALKVLI
jgi:four helix bundle protein